VGQISLKWDKSGIFQLRYQEISARWSEKVNGFFPFRANVIHFGGKPDMLGRRGQDLSYLISCFFFFTLSDCGWCAGVPDSGHFGANLSIFWFKSDI